MSSRPTVLYFGGNGHAPVRLDAARTLLAAVPDDRRLDIVDVIYPGFAGRAAARDFEGFLRGIEDAVHTVLDRRDDVFVHATGVGAMVVLAMRARDVLIGRRTVFLGPVLWGLERRRFPQLMRIPLVGRVAEGLLRLPPMQRRFERTHFRHPVTREFSEAFFAGYSQCRHFTDLFRWFTPSFLRQLEIDLASRDGALDDIELWWGAGDSVVGEREADVTDAALGVSWPRRTFPEWGHYPMIDDAPRWVEELQRALATAPASA